MTDNRIQTETHFTDLIDTKHIIDEKDRLPGRDGTPGTGMLIKEAAGVAQIWWDTKGRLMMPDFGKDPHEQVVRSGIMMGLPWYNLDKQEMLRVIAQWYANIGVNTIIDGRSTSDDNHVKKNIAETREDNAGILPILSDAGTHKKTSIDDEDVEWADGYEQIELEDKILDEQGETMTSGKERSNVKPNGKNAG